MGQIIRPNFKIGRGSHTPVLLIALIIVGVLGMVVNEWFNQSFNQSLPTVIRLQTSASQKIEVVDGDTVRIQSTRYRLIGFNTPESGSEARCRDERALARKASRRLRELLVSGQPHFQRVACACRAGTEGTIHCNDGRLCGKLTVNGADVGQTLIREGLAEPYFCSTKRCPPRRNWCT